MGSKQTTITNSMAGESADVQQFNSFLQQMLRDASEGKSFGKEISTDASPEQLARIAEIQQSSGAVARSQMEAGLRSSMGAVEANALERGVEGSTIESVMQAVNAQDHQRQLNEFEMQQAGRSSEMALNAGFQNAQINQQTNAMLLQQLLGGGQQLVQQDQFTRQGTTSQTTEESGGMGGLSGLVDIGASLAGGPLGGLVSAGVGKLFGGSGDGPAPTNNNFAMSSMPAPGSPGGWRLPPTRY